MVKLLFEYPKESAGTGQRGLTTPCPAAPFLSTPRYYPKVVSLEVSVHDFPQLIDYDGFRYSNVEIDEELSALATETLGDFFNLEVVVGTVNATDANIAFINPHDSGVTTFPIGGRIRLLDKYFGAGNFLLQLIERCPLNVWNPHSVMEQASHCMYVENISGHKLPTWGDLPTGNTEEKPDNLPPKLNEIVDDCLAVGVDPSLQNLNIPHNEEMVSFPIGLALWDDLIPYQNKSTKSQRNFGPEKGSDISWIALDDMAMYNTETGAYGTCCPLIHSVAELTELLNKTKPFIRLFKYLSHEKNSIGFYTNF